MLAIKITTAAVILVSVVFRAVMDFVWKDKRTRRYRYARNGFIFAAISGAILNVIVLAVDEVKKQAAGEVERKQRVEFENISLGALSPDIWIFLYKGNKLVCPRFDKSFPGTNFDLHISSQLGIGPDETLCLLVSNPNSFPIYDLGITLFEVNPRDNATSLTESFDFGKTPLLYPHESKSYLYNVSSNLIGKAFKFQVNTKRGSSMHTIALAFVSNQWEYASSSVDMIQHKSISLYFSDRFPRDSNGNPVIPVVSTVPR